MYDGLENNSISGTLQPAGFYCVNTHSHNFLPFDRRIPLESIIIHFRLSIFPTAAIPLKNTLIVYQREREAR